MKLIILFPLLMYPFVLKGEDYFPLQIGNNWSYDVRADVIYNWKTGFQIVDSTIENEKKYYVFNEWMPVTGNMVRVDSNKLYSYYRGTETLIIDFNIDSLYTGDFSEYYDDCGWKLTQKDTVYKYEKNLSLRTYEYHCCCFDGSIEFLEGYGPQNFYIQGDLAAAEEYTITGLIIDGNTYGNVIDVTTTRKLQVKQELYSIKIARNILGQVIRNKLQNYIVMKH